MRHLKSLFPLILSAIAILTTGCTQQDSPRQDHSSTPAHHFDRSADLILTAHATRAETGQVVVSGKTNLPDGLKMWVEVEAGRLPLGAPKDVATDENVIVSSGQFQTVPLWMDVPNTRFTKAGWPKGVNVKERQVPFPPGQYRVHFDSYFNGIWQTPEVLAELGSDDGKNLKGPILKLTDADVIDSPKVVDYRLTLPFGPITPTAKAISLVRSAILNVPEKGRSAGDIQANLDLYISSPGLSPARGWSANAKSPTTFEVSYAFINGSQGEQKAIWTANIITGEVRYVNENAKIFSWSPNY